jgi:hypothetical protein
MTARLQKRHFTYSSTRGLTTSSRRINTYKQHTRSTCEVLSGRDILRRFRKPQMRLKLQKCSRQYLIWNGCALARLRPRLECAYHELGGRREMIFRWTIFGILLCLFIGCRSAEFALSELAVPRSISIEQRTLQHAFPGSDIVRLPSAEPPTVQPVTYLESAEPPRDASILTR